MRQRGNRSGDGGEVGKLSAGSDPGRRTRTADLPIRRAGEPPASEKAAEPHDQEEEIGLPAEDRLRLIVNTNEALAMAYAAFGDACQQERAAVREAASADSGVLGLLFDVAMGLLLPGLAHGIARVVKQIPVSSSVLAQRLALALQTEEAGEMILEATGAALHHAKAGVPSDTTEIDAYLTNLAVTFQEATVEISAGLWGKPDPVIAATWAAFHPHITNLATYAAAIHRLVQGYRKTVEPIGRAQAGGRGSGDWRVEWTDTMTACEITDGAALRGLALVERRDRGDTGERRYRLVQWIPPELQEAARAKARALGDNEIIVLPISQVETGAW